MVSCKDLLLLYLATEILLKELTSTSSETTTKSLKFKPTHLEALWFQILSPVFMTLLPLAQVVLLRSASKLFKMKLQSSLTKVLLPIW